MILNYHIPLIIKRRALLSLFIFLLSAPLFSQKTEELNSGWYCKNIQEVKANGEQITGKNDINKSDWLPAVVPGTVLTTLLENGKIPDPFYGMNNEHIPDIYDTGKEHYTYWFYKEFDIQNPEKNEQFWLLFRGVNYGCDIFLNGKKVIPNTHYGMFLRQKHHVTDLIKKGMNKLAMLVYPPDPVGNPNGGQGGDGEIAKNVTHQYVAGWDWIQPVRDRNTGIWDKVMLERTGAVDIRNPHVVTMVPGIRLPQGKQNAAILKISTELKNTSDKPVNGELIIQIDGREFTKFVNISPNSLLLCEMPDISIAEPKLWWPNGYGDQSLYELSVQFIINNKISDLEEIKVGIREIQTEWNPFTKSRQIYLNGQKIFIKGGNWIISDAMLRFSKARYDAEIRMHRDMNLNTIRIWGGAITERPEFYEACDKYGILVMQDFWISGDCNGRWLDPKKKEDQWTRRNYPDDGNLFLRSASDQVKMIRNHPSLAFWCGGNELPPSASLLNPLKDTLNALDGTRWFAEYSTSDSMSFNSIGGNGDGPYGIQPINKFFGHKTFPFNSEVGSVGLPDYEGLKRYLTDDAMVIPGQYVPEKGEEPSRWNTIHPAWRYHKYLPYGDFISKYGTPEDIKDFAFKAQLVNYNQYRALMEGFSSHMWEWYTGVIIWKTQNPWTSMRGQMYDYYLDQNAGLFGLRRGGEPLHIFFDHVKGQIMIANNTFEAQNDLMIQVNTFDRTGKKKLMYQEIVSIIPTTSKRYGTIGRGLKELKKEEGIFLQMKLYDQNKSLVSENFYALPDESGDFSGLQHMKHTELEVKAIKTTENQVEVHLRNVSADHPVSYFNRISVIDKKTDLRALPVFYSDNYISIEPNGEKSITIDIGALPADAVLKIRLQGWNLDTFDVEIDDL